MPAQRTSQNPWRRAPVGELQEQLLPRWFATLIVVLTPVAVAATIAAFAVFGTEQVPVAQRRPPPAEGLTNAVGEYNVGTATPVALEDVCPTLRGVAIAGTEEDRAALSTALLALCEADLPGDVTDSLARFAQRGGVVRFAQFQLTGVDSTAVLGEDPPVILINARMQFTDPLWIAPAVAHDAAFMTQDPATAEGALAARRAEAVACEVVLAGRRASRGCDDARALLNLPDPLAALRDAGFQ